MIVQTVIDRLIYLSNKDEANFTQELFSSDKEQYTGDDVVWGIKMLEIKQVAKTYWKISLDNIEKIIKNPVHEVRLCGLLMLVERYKRSSEEEKKEIVDLYLSNTKYINSWDLVDLTCYRILGKYLVDKPRDILYQLVKSENVWEQRISIVSTRVFIRNHDFVDALALLEILIHSSHDIIHRAVGFMLKEISKHDKDTMINFVKKHYENMERITLRYAVEKLPKDHRQDILTGNFK